MNAMTVLVPIEEYKIGTLERLWDFGYETSEPF